MSNGYGSNILTLKLRGLLSTSVPDTCECHFGLYTYGAKDRYTTTVCVNPNCYTHRASYIVDALNILGIKADIGPKTAATIMMDRKLACHLDIFDENVIDINTDCYGEYMIPVQKAQLELKKINDAGGIKLGTYVSLFCYPILGKTRCSNLFAQHSSLEEFYKDMLSVDGEEVLFQEDPIFRAQAAKRFIGQKLDISEESATVNGIYRTLMDNRDELTRCLKYFKIINISSATNMKVIHIVITGSITLVTDDRGYGFRDRKDFPEFVTRKYGVNFVLDDSVKVKKPPMFLICDAKPLRPGDAQPSSSKYRAAGRMKPTEPVAELMRNLGISDSSIIVNSVEFIRLLDNGLLSL